jgi:hypothetical protein
MYSKWENKAYGQLTDMVVESWTSWSKISGDGPWAAASDQETFGATELWWCWSWSSSDSSRRVELLSSRPVGVRALITGLIEGESFSAAVVEELLSSSELQSWPILPSTEDVLKLAAEELLTLLLTLEKKAVTFVVKDLNPTRTLVPERETVVVDSSKLKKTKRKTATVTDTWGAFAHDGGHVAGHFIIISLPVRRIMRAQRAQFSVQ